jgi:hypothetical protein
MKKVNGTLLQLIQRRALIRLVRLSIFAALCFVGVGSTGISHASLIDRGGGLIYDTDLNITWLSDANYGAGSIYDNGTATRPSTTDGRMTWQNALDWAADLTYYDSMRGVTYSDWRLPTTLQPDPSCSTAPTLQGYNCSGSEMGHLFYQELGGIAKESLLTSTDLDLPLFKNIQEADYWSATRDVATFQQPPWAFGFFSGIQSNDAQNFAVHAWAVRDGDVAPVPEPSTVMLLINGLGTMGLWQWRRKGASI